MPCLAFTDCSYKTQHGNIEFNIQLLSKNVHVLLYLVRAHRSTNTDYTYTPKNRVAKFILKVGNFPWELTGTWE